MPHNGLLRRITAALDERPDHTLLTRFVETRDEAAFAALVHRHGPLVLGICRRALRNEADADDAFQAVFLVLARQAGAIRTSVSIRGWLAAVAIRACSQAKRRRAAHLRLDRAAARPGVAGQVLADELPAILDEELARLPDKYRAPLILCCLDGKSRDEAAAELGWSLGAVKIRLERGRELLRKRLAARGVSLPSALVLAAGVTVVPGAAASAAVRAACGEVGAVSAVSLAIADGVRGAMTVSKLKLVGVAAVLVLAGGIGVGAGRPAAPVAVAALAPIPAPPPPAPGQKAVSRPDNHGLVVVLRPLVTSLAPGDPVRLALRFEADGGPLDSNHPLGKALVYRDRLLDGLKVTVTRPDGSAVTLRLRPPAALAEPPDGRPAVEFCRNPDFLLGLTDDGVERFSELVYATVPLQTRKWAGDAVRLGTAPGAYTVVVSGSLVLDKGDPIPFTSAPAAVERAVRGVASLGDLVRAGRAAVGKAFPDAKLTEPAMVVEDAAGVRVVRFEGLPTGLPGKHATYTVRVRPDGTPAGDAVAAPLRGAPDRHVRILVAPTGPRNVNSGYTHRSTFDDLFWPKAEGLRQ